jgi:hypothetical protein
MLVVNVLAGAADLWQTSIRGVPAGLPNRAVTTVKDLIYHQYAKIIARSVFSMPDGTVAKGDHYGFIKTTFRDLHKKLVI